MVNQARMSAGIKDDDLELAASSISSYLAGKQQTAKEAAAAEAFLNTLPKDQIEKLKSLSMKEHYTGPKLKPGVIYEIWIDRAKIMSDSLDAAYQIRNSISGIASADPKAKEKLLDVIDAVKPSAPHQAVAPVELAVQQQQAYLAILGFNIGKAGLDGIAGKGSMTQKALDDFAQKNGIDPKDTGKVNQALSTIALKAHSTLSPAILLKDIDSGKLTAEDIKINQWLLKGLGFAMTASLQGNKMDGIAGPETKTVLRSMDEELKFQKENNRTKSMYADRTGGHSDDPLTLFKDNLRDMLKPLTDIIAEIGGVIKKEVNQMAEDAGLKAGLSGEFGRAVSAMGGMEDKVQRRDLFKEPATAPVQTGIKPT